MEKIYDWIAKHKALFLIICIAIFALPLIVVQVLYKWHLGIDWLISDWESGDVLAYIAGFEALLGTVLLGGLTLWQNERFKEENDKSQERLQKISEGQAKALEQILLMDQSSNIPLIDIKKSPKGDKFVNVELFLKEDGTAFLKVFLTNITDYPIKDIYVKTFELFTYGLKYVIDDNKSYYNPHKGLPGYYDTHVAFSLLPVTCEGRNEHFERACPWHNNTNTRQEDTQEWAFNKQFILEVTFEIDNIYSKKIIETIIYEFRVNCGKSPFEHTFSLWNKELRFEVVEESDNA